MDHISYHHNAMLNIHGLFFVRLSFLVDHFIAFVLLFTLLILLFWIVIHSVYRIVWRDQLCCLYSVTWITIENLCSLENSVYSLIAHVFLSLARHTHTLTNKRINKYIVYQIPNTLTHIHMSSIIIIVYLIFAQSSLIPRQIDAPHATKSGSKIIVVYSTLKFCCCCCRCCNNIFTVSSIVIYR